MILLVLYLMIDPILHGSRNTSLGWHSRMIQIEFTWLTPHIRNRNTMNNLICNGYALPRLHLQYEEKIFKNLKVYSNWGLIIWSFEKLITWGSFYGIVIIVELWREILKNMGGFGLSLKCHLKTLVMAYLDSLKIWPLEFKYLWIDKSKIISVKYWLDLLKNLCN